MSSTYPSARLCQRCGRALTPSEVYCNTCGQYNSPAPAGGSATGAPSSGISWGGPSPQTNYGGEQPAGQQWGQMPSPTAPTNPYGGGIVQQPVYSGNSYAQQPSLYSAPPPAPAKGFQQDMMNGYNPTGYSQPPRKGGPSIGFIMAIIILLLVLVGGGFFGYRYITNHNSKAISITPTVAPNSTPSKPPLFSDSFQDNKNGWDLTSITGKFSVKVGGGSMVLEDDNNRLLYELLPGGRTYSNFQLNVDGQLSKGDQNNGYGIFIRGASNQNSDLATYYRFELYGDGTYAIFKGLIDANGNSQSSKLVDYTSNAVVQKVGNVNHITIIANGPRMSFIVNGQTLTTITDNSYTSGTAALFVSNLPAPTPPVAQATFNNLAIYPI